MCQIQMDTHRYAKILIAKTSRRAHTHTPTQHAYGHLPLLSPFSWPSSPMEKLLEKKNNVRAYGGGERGRKFECQPGSLGYARKGG